MSQKVNLKLDWATHEAAKYACENWHYSKCMPSGKLVKIGVWENGKFIGVILYGLGATPNLSKPYGLSTTECCELVRIALKNHVTPVSKMMAISFKILKSLCAGVRLVVSFADANQNHYGKIYQATNWVYSGMTDGDIFYEKNGKLHHGRSLVGRYGTRKTEVAKKLGYKIVFPKGKYRYLMPLDKEMKLQIEKLRKPYPKRAVSIDNDAADFRSDEGGVNPTTALQKEL